MPKIFIQRITFMTARSITLYLYSKNIQIYQKLVINYMHSTLERSLDTYTFANLLKLLEHVFQDNFLYTHVDVMDLILANNKGFVYIQDLLKTNSMMDLIKCNEHLLVNISQIKRALQASKLLACRNYKIRRIQPFINKYQNKSIVPTYIDKIPKKMGKQELIMSLNEQANVHDVYLPKQSAWCIVFSDNPSSIIQGIETQRNSQGSNRIAYSVIETINFYEMAQYHNINKRNILKYKNKDEDMTIQALNSQQATQEDKKQGSLIQNKPSRALYHREMISVLNHQRQKEDQRRKQKIKLLKNYDNTALIAYISAKTPYLKQKKPSASQSSELISSKMIEQ